MGPLLNLGFLELVRIPDVSVWYWTAPPHRLRQLRRDAHRLRPHRIPRLPRRGSRFPQSSRRRSGYRRHHRFLPRWTIRLHRKTRRRRVRTHVGWDPEEKRRR
ncbi:BnaC03g12820D [Brassica napus]|uniref:BnaC03g12820D protein n=1 Tax=Brassica napus TaxID=3708 RepID=A0A078FEZ5_BRANA|nr:BnaC03g12820D [Brassica napus]